MDALIPRKLLFCLWSLLCLALPAFAQEEVAAAEDVEAVPLFTQAELDQMLAPVALYPDEMLSQLLMAATYPLEVVQAARWSRANPGLKGQDAVRAVEDQEWDPSVKAMVAFPDLLNRMDEDLDWTRRLGDAFLAQQQDVMDTVQGLRQRADQAGNLQSDDHVEVVREPQTIVIRDRYPDVVYVPYYSPYEVYGTWWWPSYRPVYWDPWPGYYASSYFYWGPSIWIGSNFYYGHCDWNDRVIRVRHDVPFYHHGRRPARDVWVHEYRHRRGVPYRDQRVANRYAEAGSPAPRVERPRHGGGRRQDVAGGPTAVRAQDTPDAATRNRRERTRDGQRAASGVDPVEDRIQRNSARGARSRGVERERVDPATSLAEPAARERRGHAARDTTPRTQPATAQPARTQPATAQPARTQPTTVRAPAPAPRTERSAPRNAEPAQGNRSSSPARSAQPRGESRERLSQARSAPRQLASARPPAVRETRSTAPRHAAPARTAQLSRAAPAQRSNHAPARQQSYAAAAPRAQPRYEAPRAAQPRYEAPRAQPQPRYEAPRAQPRHEAPQRAESSGGQRQGGGDRSGRANQRDR